MDLPACHWLRKTPAGSKDPAYACGVRNLRRLKTCRFGSRRVSASQPASSLDFCSRLGQNVTEMRTVTRCVALSLVVLSTPNLAQVPDSGRPSASPVSLTPGSVITRQGGPGDIHQYAVDLEVDTFFEMSVSQQTALLQIAIIDPDGAEVVVMDLTSLDPLPEPLMFITPRAGTYRIDVRLSTNADERAPSHLRPPRSRFTPGDRRRSPPRTMFCNAGRR